MMQRGFILVEVLIALVISSMLAGVLFFSVFQTTSTVHTLDDIINLYCRVVIATRQLERDLAGATLVQEKVKKVFLSEEKDGNCQLLTFITNNPLQQWQTDSVKPYLVRVTYKLVPDKTVRKGSEKQYILTRQESVELALDQKNMSNQQKPRAYELIDGIVGFSTIYTARQSDDNSDQEDITAWDSDSTEGDNEKREPNEMIPASVTIELELADSLHTTHVFTYDIPIVPDMTPIKAQPAVDTVPTTTNTGSTTR